MSHKVKLEAEEKARLVRKCLREELSCTEAARQADVDRETIKNWIRWYEEEGINAFLSRKNSSYSEALKREAVADYLAGEEARAKFVKSIRYAINANFKPG